MLTETFCFSCAGVCAFHCTRMERLQPVARAAPNDPRVSEGILRQNVCRRRSVVQCGLRHRAGEMVARAELQSFRELGDVRSRAPVPLCALLIL